MNPGIYPNIPFSDYKAIKAVSNSYLGKLDKCPAAALVEQQDTPSMLMGRAVHTSVLEGHIAFNERFVVAPEINRKTNAGKEAWAAFCQGNADRTVITKEQMEVISGISKAVKAHPWASRLLAENVTEQTCIWESQGLLCKARPDSVPDEGKMALIDLKTTSDASEYGFTRSITKYGYARQAAFYLDGYNAATNGKADAFIFVAVETEEPYRTEVYILDDEFIQYGREEYRRLLAIEQDCRTKGKYPHYTGNGIRPYTTINKPAYL